MIEKIVLDYLAPRIRVPCGFEVPEQPTPPKYVVLERTGSSERNHLHSISLAVQCCAVSLFDAAALCERVTQIMAGIIELPRIGHCQLLNAYNHTDPRTKTYRYQAVFQIYYTEV